MAAYDAILGSHLFRGSLQLMFFGHSGRHYRLKELKAARKPRLIEKGASSTFKTNCFVR